MLGHIPAAAPADLRHGRNVQSGHQARRLRLQSSRRGRARPVDRVSTTRWPTGSCKPTLAPPDNPRVTAHALLRLRSRAAGRSGHGAAQAVRHPPRRPQLVALEGGGRRAAAGVRADPRPGRRDRLHRPVVGRAAGRGAGRRARRQRSGRIPRAFRRLRIQHQNRRDVHRRDPDDEHRAHQHLHAAARAASPEASDAEVFRDFLRRHHPAADAGRGPRATRSTGPRPGADAAAAGSPRSCSMPCAGRTTTGTWCRTSAATWSRTTPTTSGSRSWSRRCGIDRRLGSDGGAR